MNGEDAGMVGSNDAYYASGSTVKIDLVALAGMVTDADALGIITTNVADYVACPTGSYITFSDIVFEKFEEPELEGPYAILADMSSYAAFYPGRPTGVEATADSITVSCAANGSTMTGFMLTKAAIDELVALGYVSMQFTVTSDAPYVGFFSADNSFVMNGEDAGMVGSNDAYYASGSTVKIDLVALAGMVTDADALGIITTNVADYVACPTGSYITFSDIIFA